MKRKLSDLHIILISVILISAVFGAAESFALGETSRQDHAVAAGVTESTVYVSVDSGYNVRTHILRISEDASVSITGSYGDYYGDDSTRAQRKKQVKNWEGDDWTFESVRDQASDYEESADAEGSVIAAANGDFFDIKSGRPEGSLVLEGNMLRSNRNRPFFAVLKSGKAVIRRKGGRLRDTETAVSGRELLLWKGRYTGETDGLRNPRTAIGLCSDGTVVIVSVDGREPASAGVTLKELAAIMRAQECRSAVNLDGGGSVSFMTDRGDGKGLRFRTNHSDGPERNVGPALLIVKKEGSSAEVSGSLDTVSMESGSTGLSIDPDGVYSYTVNGKGKSGFYAVNGKAYLFSDGKGESRRIRIGKTVYSFTGGRLDSVSDKKAGNVVIGYCGASKNGRNLIYAYHDGDKLLNIGINPLLKNAGGKMKNWNAVTLLQIPWYSVRAEIERLYIANGVENTGECFLYSTKGDLTGGADAPVCRLRSVRLPASLRRIGAYSFFNKPKLSGVKIPAAVKKIGYKSFAYSGRGVIRFQSKTPPSFGSSALKKTGFSSAYVRRSKAWKRFVKKKLFRKYGFKKKAALRSLKYLQ